MIAGKKCVSFLFFPAFKKEADEVVRQVEVLGKDPLTVMQNRAESTNSKLYRNFLGGFVSSVRSGGKLVDYMKSQLKSIFELRYINMNRSIERIAALVEAYSVMLIVVLCTYILFVVFASDKRYAADDEQFNLDFARHVLPNSVSYHAVDDLLLHFNSA